MLLRRVTIIQNLSLYQGTRPLNSLDFCPVFVPITYGIDSEKLLRLNRIPF